LLILLYCAIEFHCYIGIVPALKNLQLIATGNQNII